MRQCVLLAAFRCDFWYFFIAFCCFLAALLFALCSCLPAFWARRALFGPMKIWALAGVDHAKLNATSSTKAGIRFMIPPEWKILKRSYTEAAPMAVREFNAEHYTSNAKKN
jgi:hypothetical protein